ncbi:serine protease, partial [Streptomyces sp. FH025]|uniref:trypsin-like serine peptidase n=1 Tax=Streptomyces sp. FH025 TaxID=2815937 RepID=UPI001A9D7055
MPRRTTVLRSAAAATAALLLGAGLAPVASAATPNAGDPAAERLSTYWTAARMAAALPVDTERTTAETPATADGPRPGEFIPPSRSFDGIPQAGTFFWTGADGTGRTCSGSVVHSPDHNLVLSAGHCLKGYSGTSPRRNLGFVPQYHDGLKPFGIFPVEDNGVYVSQAYYDLGEHAGAAYDFGFAVTGPNRDGERLEDVAGGVRLLTDTGYFHAPVRMTGYPGGAQKPLECLSWTTRWESDDPADPGTPVRAQGRGPAGGAPVVAASYRARVAEPKRAL